MPPALCRDEALIQAQGLQPIVTNNKGNKMRILYLLLIVIFFPIESIGQKTIEDYTIFGDKENIYKSIDDILEMDGLRNKVVYVDIWGTHCGPCIREFSNLPELKTRFKNDSVVFLYLCSPYKVKWDKKNAKLWEELIVKHDLSGINILISAECYMDGFYEKYKDKFSPQSMYAIPRYLLVDKKGVIADFNAPRPSSKEKLFSAIQALIDEDCP